MVMTKPTLNPLAWLSEPLTNVGTKLIHRKAHPSRHSFSLEDQLESEGHSVSVDQWAGVALALADSVSVDHSALGAYPHAYLPVPVGTHPTCLL